MELKEIRKALHATENSVNIKRKQVELMMEYVRNQAVMYSTINKELSSTSNYILSPPERSLSNEFSSDQLLAINPGPSKTGTTEATISTDTSNLIPVSLSTFILLLGLANDILSILWKY